MTSSTWSFESTRPLFSCGIDAERIDRFAGMADRTDPMPLVFTPREIEHSRGDEHPAEVLCVCFCAKEAVLKALGTPYDLTDCEVFPAGTGSSTEIFLSGDLAGEHGVLTKGLLEYRHCGGSDEIVACAYLFSEEDKL